MTTPNRISSFTSASSFPIKILQNNELMYSLIVDGKVIPYHVQLNPTNVCNFNCNFCSCKNREKSEKINRDDLIDFIDNLSELGTKAITITGGGEPTFYPFLEEIIEYCEMKDIEVGLVTNGSNLSSVTEKTFNNITWCRISCSDVLPSQVNMEQWYKTIEKAVVKNLYIDWAFSYVISSKPNYLILGNILDFANNHNFTHVRIVSDILDVENTPDMNTVKHNVKELGVNDSLAIYQGRKNFTHGAKVCYISLLKPVIGANGGIYPCCGTQYALDNPSLDYEKTMQMGTMEDLPDLIDEQKFFDGSKCVKCYYNEYNELIKQIVEKTLHKRFI
jgi:organic radical activating enzyme